MRLMKQAAVLALLTLSPLGALAALPEVVIEIRDHLFIPQTVRIPEAEKYAWCLLITTRRQRKLTASI